MKKQNVKFSDLHPDPNQPRKTFDADDIAAFRRNIDANGYTDLIRVVKDEEGYRLFDGERRMRAMEKLEQYSNGSIPVLVLTEDEANGIIGQLATDGHKKKYLPSEVITAVRRASKDGYTVDAIATALGVNQTTAQKYLFLGDFDENRLKMLDSGEMDMETLQFIRGLDPADRDIAFKAVEGNKAKSHEGRKAKIKAALKEVKAVAEAGEEEPEEVRNAAKLCGQVFNKIYKFKNKGGKPSLAVQGNKNKLADFKKDLSAAEDFVKAHKEALMEFEAQTDKPV